MSVLQPIGRIILGGGFRAAPEAQATAEMSQFMENFALAGASLMLLHFTDRSWPYGVGGSSAGDDVG